MHPTTVTEASDRSDAVEAAPADEAARPARRRRGPKPAAAEAAPTPAAAPASAPERRPQPAPLAPRGVRSAPARDDDYDAGVRGFGADTPAFLMRAPPRRSSAED